MDGGPLAAEEAVRLGARLCRAIESLHAKKERHGALSAAAVRLPTEDLSKAVVARPTPLQKRTRDDVDAIARLVHFALTGQETKAAEKPSALGVFDVGDDELDGVLAGAWSDPPEVVAVAKLRERLETWLEETTSPMPWDERGFEPALELSALPPPPAVPESVARRAPSNPRESFDFEEDRETIPGEAKPELLVRKPRLVPPKLSSSKKKERPEPLNDASEDEVESAPGPSTRSWPMLTVFVVAALLAAGYAWFSTRDHAGAPQRPLGSATNEASDRSSVEPGQASSASASASSSAFASDSSVPSALLSDGSSAFASDSSSPSAFASSSSSPSAFASGAALSAFASSAAWSAFASSSSSPSASASAEATEKAQRCITDAFPADTFAGTFTDLSPLCAQSNLVQGAQDLRLVIVRAGTGRSVTAGMKEWSQLGSYELPAFAIIQARCCAASSVKVPSGPAGCPMSLDAAIHTLTRTDLGVKKDLSRTINDLDRSLRCIERSGSEKRFGGYKPLSGGEVTPFRKLVARLPAKPRL